MRSRRLARVRAINPWGSWVVPRGRQSMGSWIAPVLLLVRCLVRASIYGVVGSSDPLASFHVVVDSVCGITQDSLQENIFSMYGFDVSFAVLSALFLLVTSTTSLRLQARQQAGRQSGAITQASTHASDQSMGIMGSAARASIHGCMDSARVAPCSLSC